MTAFARRVVEVIAGDGATPPHWTVSSGLLVAPRLVLTSAHGLTGLDVRVRGLSPATGTKETWPATVVDAGDVDDADLALLRVDHEDLDDIERLRFVRVDRDSTAPRLIPGCGAVGFPRFKEIPRGGDRRVPMRETAHVTGDLPTLDQLVSGLLTLRVSSSPRPLPAQGRPLHDSEWAGMSGAVVTADDAIIGVITEHQPRAGPSELTVTPVSHIERLGRDRVAVWSATLGLDVTALPTLSGNPVAPVQHFHIGRDLVMSQTVVPAFRARPVAPSPPPHFAGRRAELDQLTETLRAGRTVAITGIQGMGGIGKTALALQVAAETTEFSVVLWASLGPDPNVVSHLLSWARHADPDFQAGDAPVDVLAARVRGVLAELVRDHYPGPVLVILDDVWEGASVTAARLLRTASPPGAVHLLTTRSQLVVAQLRGTRLELAPIEPADALRMLRNLLPGHPDIADADLMELAAAVGHHPLAIELAAGQVQLLERPAEEIGDLVARYRGGVPAGSPFGQISLELGESREDSLELVLSFSYADLAPTDQADFRALGALAYGVPFDRLLCAALWRREPKDVLDRLRHRAMLAVAPDRGWYQQHSLLRAYARALLRATPDQQASVEDAYTEFVAEKSVGFAELPVDRWAELEPYVPHVEEAGTLLVAASTAGIDTLPTDDPLHTRAVEFALNTRSLLAARRELDHVDWLAAGLAVCQHRMDLGRVVDLVTEIARHRAFRGDVPAAARLLSEAREVADRTGDRRTSARAKLDVGEFFLYTDPDSAIRPLRESLDGYESLGDERGIATALLRLAEWHATWPHSPAERAGAVEPLSRAGDLAERAGFTDLRAEAVLALGRLYDTFGAEDEAVPLLTEGVTLFVDLRMRAREAVARTFLAGALANAGDLDRAEEELSKAVPLFSSVGDATGHATALRNLGELHAKQGRPGPALASFGAALPLVHKMSMRYLDEDQHAPAVVPGFFSAHLEPVTALERAEQFRVRIPRDGDAATPGTIADELLAYLLTGTLRTTGAAREEWGTALAGFAEQLDGYGDTFGPERDLVAALRDMTAGRTPRDLPDGSPYAGHLRVLLARSADGPTEVTVLTAEGVEQHVTNTFVVRTRQPEHEREWTTMLRRTRRSARDWGDTADEPFYAALLAVLAGRPAALPVDNPHHTNLEALLRALDDVERRPSRLVVERTVAVCTVAPDERDEWLDVLRGRHSDARRRRDVDETELFAALIDLVTGRTPDLPVTNPYREEVDQAGAAIAANHPLPTMLPRDVLSMILADVSKARTTEPKSVDHVRWQLEVQAVTARDMGRWAEVELYIALHAIAGGSDVPTPDSAYGEVVQQVADALRDTRPEPGESDTLPPEQVDMLMTAAISGVVDADPQARGELDSYREDLAGRGPYWRPEADYLAALVDLFDGRPAGLPADHPYREPVETAAEMIQRHRAVQARGGNLAGPQLAHLIDGTVSRMRAPYDHFEAELGEGLGDVNSFTEMLNRAHDLSLEQARWKEEVHGLLVDVTTKHPDWRHEIEFIKAVVDVLDAQRARLSQDSPYRQEFDELLAALPPTHDLPDSLTALGSSPDEHQDHFRNRVTGRARFIDQIPTALANTVMMRTIMPEQAESWHDQLGRTAGSLAEYVSDMESFETEIELLNTLRDIVSGGRPELAPAHPHHAQVRLVLDAIDLFDDRLTWPGNLGGDYLRYFYGRVCGAMSVFPEYHPEVLTEVTELREAHSTRHPDDLETRAFLDALLVVLADRPADLPPTNRYWPFLRIIGTQIAALRQDSTT